MTIGSNCSKSVSKANKTVNILGVYKPEEGISFISNNKVAGLKSSLRKNSILFTEILYK
ncbi:hypothetical protein GCM10023173_16440 [Sphingobacterium thermophilum]|uniref:Uncharacterized protein n=1 Tax=Sphingobacterium thermophilum TaxID=768534 RepID=A0ABP8R361_9SPHI